MIVAFFGSFNPILTTHTGVAEQMAVKFGVKALFVPCSDFYAKKDLAPARDRYKMLQLVCAENSNFLVSRVEIDYALEHDNHQLKTIETLRLLQKEFPDDEIRFCIGSDNYVKFPTDWTDWQELIEDYHPIILERTANESIANPILRPFRNKIDVLGNLIHFEENGTSVRARIRDGESCRYLMPDCVWRYIHEHKLYLKEET